MKCAIALACLIAALLTGCGGGDQSAPTPRSRTAGDAKAQDSLVVLERAVRRAIEEDHRMSVRVLWTNRVPRHPTATAGPALANLRTSAAQRRRQHIRVRVISERFRILDLRLDPSYTSATATVLDVQQTQPSHADGKPLGRPVRLSERARLVLRRVGSEPRFVVWKVTLAR